MAAFLAFDTSERNATAAVFEGTECIAHADAESWAKQRTVSDAGSKGTSSTTIIGLIKHVFKQASVRPESVSAIAFSNGPGTFTGVRVGVVAARMLCYAWKKPMVVVNSLDVVAEKLARHRKLESGCRIWSAVNAQRGEVFAAAYDVGRDHRPELSESMSLYSRQEFVESLRTGDLVTGSGIRLFGDAICQVTNVQLPTSDVACCDASAVAHVALHRIERKSFDDLHLAKPIYFRPSAAEEVRIAKGANASTSAKST